MKKTHGGKRLGAGKPALYKKPMKKIVVTLDEETLALLAQINPNRSKAIREAARMAVSEQPRGATYKTNQELPTGV